MGYYTWYQLEVIPEEEITEELLNESVHDGDFKLRRYVYPIDADKWYDHDQDMLRISEKYPDLLFILDGDGDESGDIWRSFYKGGKMYTWSADVNPPEFDETLLSGG